MAKTLVSLPQITPPPDINSNAALLTNISVLSALNPKELLALAVYLRAKELAHDASSPLTTYDPGTAANIDKLVQDSQAVIGNIPTGDLMRAAVAIDWANCKAVYASISSDVDTLRGLLGSLAERSEDELRRINLYLRLEIGE